MPQLEARARKVLVVDDDPFIMELIITRLALAGYATAQARDGRKALERLADFRPEAMVLDLNMPRLDGFGVLREMQASKTLSKPSTLVLTARNQAEDVQLAIALGAKDYMSKPFRDDQLLARVGRLLARARVTA